MHIFIYFQWFRLWQRENQNDRFIIFLQKSQGNTSFLRIKPKGNMSRMKNQVPGAQVKTVTVTGNSKKIKFDD